MSFFFKPIEKQQQQQQQHLSAGHAPAEEREHGTKLRIMLFSGATLLGCFF